MTCAWIETSSAETGSSHDDQARLERKRARNADALALAAGELVRVVLHLVGPQPDLLEQFGDARLLLARRRERRARCSGSPTMSPARHARIERGERILEDDLHCAAIRAASRPG